MDGSIRVWPEAEIAEILDERVPIALWRPPRPPQEGLEVRQARETGKGWVVRFEGCSNREEAANLANCWMVARREDLPEPKDGCVYSFDLIGARLETKGGRLVGTVTDLFETAAHHVVQVETDKGKEFLVPLTEEVDADLRFAEEPDQTNRLLVHLPDGMEEATETPEKRRRGPSEESEGKKKETC